MIVVANRGPVSYARDATGRRVATRGGGGLVTALRGLIRYHDVTWIASAMSDEDRTVALESAGGGHVEESPEGSSYRLRLIAHGEHAYDLYYNVLANPTLWFVQHYLWSLAYAPDWDRELHAAWRDGYVAVNRAFADAVLEELERTPDADVFLHDYHLYLAPRMIREARPETRLAQFVHIPWPQSDYWHVVPHAVRAAIHDGLLANDLIGLHAERWRRNFVAASRDLVGATVREDVVEYGGRRIETVTRPISVDVAEFDALKDAPAVRAAEDRLVSTRPERIVLRVDRTDLSKNVIRGLRAFALFLDDHPEARGRVRMLALLDPSRQAIPAYERYLAEIEQAAADVNARHPDAIDLRVEDDFPTSVAAYKQFDVLLVNAIFDGLNLVAKEAPLVNERSGAVVLSENTGVHEELAEWVVTVNPFDIVEQAEAIALALELPPAERRRRLEAIRAHVRAHDVAWWLERVLADLDRATAAA